MKGRVKLIAVFLTLTGLYACLSASTTILPEKQLMEFKGFINKTAIRMILQNDNGSVVGIYCYEKANKVIFLKGKVDSSGSFRMTEFIVHPFVGIAHNPIDVCDTGGFFIGSMTDTSLFKGNWISTNGKLTYKFNLKRKQIPLLDLKTIYSNFTLCKSDADLQFLICTQLTKNLFNLNFLVFGGDNDKHPSELIKKSNSQLHIFKRNFFGDDSTEKLLALNFSDEQTFLFVFHQYNGSWLKTPCCIWSKSFDGTAHSCIARHNPEDTMYFSWHFSELFKKNEFALVCREYRGKCGGVYPYGNDVEFEIIKVSQYGFTLVYRETQDHYLFSTSSTAPIDKPERHDFKIVAGRKKEFPRRLERADYLYGADITNSTQPHSGKKITYIEFDPECFD